MTLEEAIAQQINLGHKNPHDIFEAIERQLGEELVEIAKPYLADFIADMARQKLGQRRRSEIAKIRPDTVKKPAEIKLQSLWVPTHDGQIVYKRIGDMVPEEFDARATFLESLAAGITRHAQWCRDTATAIRDGGYGTAGELGEFPQLDE